MYFCSTAARWQGPVISRWSRHSRRSVPIQRSTMALARDACTGVSIFVDQSTDLIASSDVVDLGCCAVGEWS